MKKGISIASLGIALIILSIISGIVVINSREYLNETKKAKFVTEYMLVETAVNKYYDNNGSYPIKKVGGVEETILLVASDDADKVQFGTTYGQASVGISLKVIDVSLLGYDDLTRGSGETDKDYYGISTAGVIYYVQGIRYNNKVYYMVTDALK